MQGFNLARLVAAFLKIMRSHEPGIRFEPCYGASLEMITVPTGEMPEKLLTADSMAN